MFHKPTHVRPTSLPKKSHPSRSHRPWPCQSWRHIRHIWPITSAAVWMHHQSCGWDILHFVDQQTRINCEQWLSDTTDHLSRLPPHLVARSQWRHVRFIERLEHSKWFVRTKWRQSGHNQLLRRTGQQTPLWEARATRFRWILQPSFFSPSLPHIPYFHILSFHPPLLYIFHKALLYIEIRGYTIFFAFSVEVNAGQL